MIIKDHRISAIVSHQNWPLVVDLFVRAGYPEDLLEKAKENSNIKLKVQDVDKIVSELSAWGIPWRKDFHG